jgi:hypothetical protein
MFMINRRTFIKGVAGGLAGSISYRLANANVVEQPKVYPDGPLQLDNNFKVYRFFNVMNFRDGEVSEIPLDFCSTRCLCMLTHKRPSIVEAVDYVHIPTYNIGSEGNSSDDTINTLREKFNLDAALLLYTRALSNHTKLVGKSRQHVESQMKEYFGKNAELMTCTYGNYILGVDQNKDTRIIAVRQEPTVFYDWVKGNYYSWAEIGFASIANDVILGELT